MVNTLYISSELLPRVTMVLARDSSPSSSIRRPSIIRYVFILSMFLIGGKFTSFFLDGSLYHYFFSDRSSQSSWEKPLQDTFMKVFDT